jgi:hypothetical protein
VTDVGSATKKSARGRAVVYSLFLGVVIYAVIALIGSIVTEIYGRPPPGTVGSLSRAERTWCIRAIVDLREELEGKVTLELQRPTREPDPFDRWRSFDSKWAERLDASRTRCAAAGNPALDEALGNLVALHGGYVSVVEQMITTRSTAAAKLGDSLGVLKKQP